jgi:hypothetical protein
VAFDVVMSPQFLVNGRMLLVPWFSCCLAVVELIYRSFVDVVPILDGTMRTDIPVGNRGVVRVGQG